MNKSKLISLFAAIKSAWNNLFENESLGFNYKAFLTIFSSGMLIIFMLLLLAIISSPIIRSIFSMFTGPSMPTNMPNYSSGYDSGNIIIDEEFGYSDELDYSDDFDYPMEEPMGSDPFRYQADTPADMPTLSSGGPLSIIIPIISLVITIIVMIFTGTFLNLVPIKIQQKNLLSMRELFSETFRKFFKFTFFLIIISLIYLVLTIIVGIPAFIVQGIILKSLTGFIQRIVVPILINFIFSIPILLFTITVTLFAPYILLKDNVGIFGSFKRNMELTKGYRINLLLKVLLLQIIFGALFIPLIILLQVSMGILLPILISFISLIFLKILEDLENKHGEQEPATESPPSTPTEIENSEEEKKKKGKKEEKVKAKNDFDIISEEVVTIPNPKNDVIKPENPANEPEIPTPTKTEIPSQVPTMEPTKATEKNDNSEDLSTGGEDLITTEVISNGETKKEEHLNQGPSVKLNIPDELPSDAQSMPGNAEESEGGTGSKQKPTETQQNQD